jgi:hypothetical protein
VSTTRRVSMEKSSTDDQLMNLAVCGKSKQTSYN